MLSKELVYWKYYQCASWMKLNTLVNAFYRGKLSVTDMVLQKKNRLFFASIENKRSKFFTAIRLLYLIKVLNYLFL